MTKYTVNIDWFEFIASGYTLTNSDAKTFHLPTGDQMHVYKEKQGTKFFRDCFSIFINQKKFISIMCNPPEGSIIKANYMQMRVENERFYEVGWLDCLKMIFRYYSWNMENITRMDIALDGHGFMNVARKVHNGSIVCMSRAMRFPVYNSKMELVEFRLGNYGSDRSLKVYNKSQELKVSNKHYIANLWQLAGLDTSTDVERLEVSLRNQFCKAL